jgi:hypothetical protein
MTSPSFRAFRRTIYGLKRRYPLTVDIYHLNTVTTDPSTGIQSAASATKVTIKKAILLPQKEVRAFVYDRSYISASPKFTMGAMFDHKTRKIVIDNRDIPSGFVVDLSNYVIFNNVCYQVKEINNYENGEAFLLVLDSVDGAKFNQIISLQVNEYVAPDEEGDVAP